MRDIPNTSGIYKITCTATGKMYIGSSVNLRKRQWTHFNSLRQNKHYNPHLQRAWNKHGEQSFTFDVLELVLPLSVGAREQYWLDTLKPFGIKGYNIALDTVSPTLGRIMTAEAIGKMRQSNIGKHHIQRHDKRKPGCHRNYPKNRKKVDRELSVNTREKMRLSAIARHARKRQSDGEVPA